MDDRITKLEQQGRANRALLIQVLKHLKKNNGESDDLETLFSTLNDAMIRIEQLEERAGGASLALTESNICLFGGRPAYIEKFWENFWHRHGLL
tara:strand:- start:41 stop:322 length:282 start_codon:yes stop_codon:yes gene_type:complete